MLTRGLLLILIFAAVLRGQDQPLGITGTFTTGYYSTTSRGEINQSLSFIPFGANFDIKGFYKSPDFLNFSAQPELNEGPQASEAGFQGGNGIKFQTTLLRKLVPLTFHYSNVQVEDVYFGSLTQVSGYTLKDRNKDLGLTLELKPSRLPTTIIDWGMGSVDAQSDIGSVPDYTARSNHINVDSRYRLDGWVMDGFVHHQQQTSDLLEPADGGTVVGSLVQSTTQIQGSARHDVLEDGQLMLDAGRQSTSSLFSLAPIGLSTNYARVNLRMFQKRRWKASFLSNYSSNVASLFLAQAIGSVTAPGAVVPDQSAFQPYSHGVSNLNLAGSLTGNLGAGFGVYLNLERNAVLSTSVGGPLAFSYLTTSGGVTYSHNFRRGAVSAEYGREFGHGSVTGQSGTIQGQSYRVTAQRELSSRVQLEGTVRGSDQSVHNTQPLSSRTLASEGSLSGRVVGDFSARLGGGWQQTSFTNAGNEFRTNGYTGRAGIDHPRFQLSAALSNELSNTLPFYTQFLTGLGIGSVVLPPLEPIPSNFRATTFTLHTNPIRKVELSAMWTRSRQIVAGYLGNDFELLNVYATYHFRKIQLEAGYIHSSQLFALYPDTVRKRFYVRILRPARIL